MSLGTLGAPSFPKLSPQWMMGRSPCKMDIFKIITVYVAEQRRGTQSDRQTVKWKLTDFYNDQICLFNCFSLCVFYLVW